MKICFIPGYEATVFGERSQCYFRSMPWIPVDVFEVDVIVELPVLEVFHFIVGF